jgi:hypothetical protein
MYLVSTIAGKQEGYRDGKGEDALFADPRGICMDKAKNLFVADTANHCIRKITPDGYVSTYAGSPGIEEKESGIDMDTLEQCFYSSDLISFHYFLFLFYFKVSLSFLEF